MTEIEYVSETKVSLIKSNATDFDVAKAAWVSNYGDQNFTEPYDGYEVMTKSDAIEKGLVWEDYGYAGDFVKARNKERTDWEAKIQGLINFLYRERHMSPFEHGSLTFFIDAPLFVVREFQRHRTWSYNETSGRYKEMAPRFWLGSESRIQVPGSKVGNYKFDTGTPEQTGIYWAGKQRGVQTAWEIYQERLAAGVAKEQAREELPLSLMTQFYATANPRNVMQFLLLRNDPAALKEIRDVAVQIEELFAKKMPFTYNAYKENDWRDEKSELTELRKKVAQYEAEETYKENIYA